MQICDSFILNSIMKTSITIIALLGLNEFLINFAMQFLKLCRNELSSSGPGLVQVRSRLGPGQLHVNSKSFNIKVYFKSLRDLDLELEAIIAMSPPPPPPPIKLF